MQPTLTRFTLPCICPIRSHAEIRVWEELLHIRNDNYRRDCIEDKLSRSWYKVK